jgi:Zn finger protein HypA/HybF involved in hydrogenase expression
VLKITNAQIKRQVQIQGSIGGAARALSMSWDTVKKAVLGTRKEPEWDGIAPEDRCTCCGVRVKAKGNRYLCSECYSTAECGVVYTESSFNYRAAREGAGRE